LLLADALQLFGNDQLSKLAETFSGTSWGSSQIDRMSL